MKIFAKTNVMEKQKKKENNAGCAVVCYQCIEFNCIQVGVLEQLSDSQFLMKFLYTTQEQLKGCVFFTYGFSSLLRVCFQECSFQLLYECFILYRK